MITAFRQFIGSNAMMAYLVMMAPRLVELHRVLKPTGSIYLHCDPTASHYLKILMDTVFGGNNFHSEVIWKRTSAHNAAKRFGPVHDTLLLYSKSDGYVWNRVLQAYDQSYLDAFYRYADADGRRYTVGDLTGAGVRHGESGRVWRGQDPTSKGRHWALPRNFPGSEKLPASILEALDYLDAIGRLHWPSGDDGVPRFKRYLEDMEGVAAQDVIVDITPVSSRGKERLGYPTQKPEALLERIIQASSNEGDIVLDPFCGCGTAVAAAEKLKRRWIGVDITHLAVALMKNRLKTTFNIDAGKDYQVIGEPEDAGSARALWEQDPYQFQYWAMSLLEAQPQADQKRGADRGIDGLLHFIDGKRRTPHKVVVQVKGGHVSSPQVRDLKGTVEREKAAIGLFITLEDPTAPMQTEAVTAGHYHSEIWQRDYPKIQIRTVSQLLTDHHFDLPHQLPSYEPAQRHQQQPEQGRLA